jgi:hypothetical protein
VDVQSIQETNSVCTGKATFLQESVSAEKKAAPFLGPPFKEAERREVREDFARCRSDGQNDKSGVVENNELW